MKSWSLIHTLDTILKRPTADAVGRFSYTPSMLSYPLRQLQVACDAEPLTRKILFVPRLGTGYTLLASLARHGVSWTNLHVTTPVECARDLTQVDIAMGGGRFLGSDEGWLLAGEVLAHRSAEAEACYGRIGPSTPQALYKTLSDLRQGGIGPAEIEHAERSHHLRTLLAEYERQLENGKWWDEAAILLWATQNVGESDPPQDVHYLILDETELSTREEAFVTRRSGPGLQRIGRAEYGAEVPSRCAHRLMHHVSVVGLGRVSSVSQTPGTQSARAAGLVQGDLFLDSLLEAAQPELTTQPEDVDVEPAGRLLTTGLATGDAATVRLWQAIGHESEVRAVLRDLLDRQLPLDDVEIVYPTAHNTYLPLLYDAICRFEIAADFAGGVPASMTRVGRCLRAFLTWIAQDLDGRVLIDALRAGDISWNQPEVSVAQVTAWLLQGRVDRGRDAAAMALRRVAARSSRSPDDQARQQALQQAEDRLQQFVAYVPDEKEIDLPQLAQGALGFLQMVGAEQETDREESLLRRLANISAIGVASRRPLQQQAQRLLHQLTSVRVNAQEPGPGRLAISSIADGGYSGRSHLYVLGLSESHFPSPTAPDSALSDADRERGSLPLSRDRPQADTMHLVRVMGVSRQVTLSAHRLALANGREPFPTPLFSQAERQLEAKPRWQRPMSVTGTGCDDLERLLGQRRRQAYSGAIAEAFGAVHRGFDADRARGLGVTRFDGWIGSEVNAMDIDRPWSARMLETLASCPRRWLWEDGLRLTVVDEPARDPRRWLQPMEMGNLLHGVFLDFMRYLQDRGQRPDADDAAALVSMVDVAIEQMQTQVPVTMQAAYRNDRHRIEQAAQVFLQAEAEHFRDRPGLQAVEFERDFGGPDDPTAIHLGEATLPLRGRIDRIDRVPGAADEDPTYEVWDYKTGSTYDFDQADLLAGGRRLQWALYALVVPHLLGEAAYVSQSGYLFSSDRGAGQRFAASPPSPHDLGRVLQPLLEMVRQGLFPAIHKGGAGQPCRFCDFRRICSTEAHDEKDLANRREMMAHWTGLVEGWAQAKATARAQASQVVEKRLAESGLNVADIGPLEALDQINAWMSS